MQKLNYSKKKQNYAVSACKSDFLAFEQYSCYKPPVFNLISLFDMSAFGRLTGTFSSLAAATMLFATPACAQEAPDSANHAAATQVAVASGSAVASPTNYQMSDDAQFEADRWVVDHPDRVAVSVRIGDQSRVPLENIEILLRRDFAALGITNVAFFWETGGAGGTGVMYHSDAYVSDPFGLDVARRHVSEVVERMQFNPTMAYAQNMN